jgi:hypothetical protein
VIPAYYYAPWFIMWERAFSKYSYAFSNLPILLYTHPILFKTITILSVIINSFSHLYINLSSFNKVLSAYLNSFYYTYVVALSHIYSIIF